MYKADFPIFSNQPNLVYLDSAATAQKPECVIIAIQSTLTREYGAVGRGLYPLSVQATEHYEHARSTIANFFSAQPEEIILTSGATGAVNLLAHALGQTMQSGDEIILSLQEHHSNLLPWQLLAEERHLTLKYLPITSTGEIDLEKLPSLLSAKTKIVSLTHVSNVIGSITPVTEVKKLMHEQGSDAVLIIDGCQSAPHFPISVHELGADFFIASGHKLYGPSGIGILWGRQHSIALLPPTFPGGGTVETVNSAGVAWKTGPSLFEAGSPNLEGAIGLATALTYLENIGMPTVAKHTEKMSNFLKQTLEAIPGISLLGNPKPGSGIVSFVHDSIHAHDLAELLAEQQVCIRAGHHCTGPLHEALNIPASARASIGIYTTEADILSLGSALTSALERFHA